MTPPIPPDGIHVLSGGTPRYGVVLRLHISDRFYDTEIQLAAAATSDATVPLTSTAARLTVNPAGVSKFTHFLPNDDTARHYRARHIADGFDDGLFSDWVCAKPIGLALSAGGGPAEDVGGGESDDDGSALATPWGNEGRRRGDTFYDDDARLKNLVRVRDGTGDFELNRHNESGLAQHSSAVTCSDAFEAPLVLRELADPETPEDGVVIRITASGICRSDLHSWHGHWPEGATFPMVLGPEVCGQIGAGGPAGRRRGNGGLRPPPPLRDAEPARRRPRRCVPPHRRRRTARRLVPR